jgi:GNAT superfamily N-acetyltransferase
MRVIAITSDQGEVIEPDWLMRSERVHRQLRPQLPVDYAVRLQEVFAAGARMAVVVDSDDVVSGTIWRIGENTYEGRRLYVDVVVSDESWRSHGAGRMLLSWLEAKARTLGCDVLALDSGVQRTRAHRFYFREGMFISAYCFKKALS